MSKKLTTASGVTATARRAFARMTARSRALPDFVVIGSQKAGTVSLASYFRDHPDVFWPDRKEIHYFDWSYDRSLSWYRAWFARRSELDAHWRATGRPARVGEKTPDYLVIPDGPARVKAALPDARLVVSLREPVSRAHSQWSMNLRQGSETLSFPEAIAAEDARLASVDHTKRLRGSHYFKHGYMMRGRYADHLERWFEAFDRSQILVYRSEDLYADPGQWLPRILEHVGVEVSSAASMELPHANTGDRRDLDPALREQLVAGFADADARLQDLVGLSYYQGVS
jgi:Sulfotransferase domain